MSTITGIAQPSRPPVCPSTTSSVTAAPAIASGAITRALGARSSIKAAPAPTNAAPNGARNET